MYLRILQPQIFEAYLRDDILNLQALNAIHDAMDTRQFLNSPDEEISDFPDSKTDNQILAQFQGPEDTEVEE